MHTLNAKEQLKRVKAVKKGLDEYEVTNIHKEMTSVLGSAPIMSSMISLGCVVKKDDGIWHWNKEMKVDPKLCSLIFEGAKAKRRAKYAANKNASPSKEVVVKRQPSVEKLSSPDIAETLKKATEISESMSERLDKLEAIDAEFKLNYLRDRIHLADLRADVGFILRGMRRNGLLEGILNG